MSIPNRQPAGIPTGGQFATSTQGRPDVALTIADNPVRASVLAALSGEYSEWTEASAWRRKPTYVCEQGPASHLAGVIGGQLRAQGHPADDEQIAGFLLDEIDGAHDNGNPDTHTQYVSNEDPQALADKLASHLTTAPVAPATMIGRVAAETGWSKAGWGSHVYARNGVEVSVDTGDGIVSIFEEAIPEGWEPGDEMPIVEIDYDHGDEADKQRAVREAFGRIDAASRPLTDTERRRLADLEAEFEEAGGRGVELAEEIDDLRRRAALVTETPAVP